MKTKQIMYLIILSILFGCSASRNNMIKKGENAKDIAIHNAILDFSTNCNLYKKDSVFSVRFRDSLYHVTSEKINDGGYRSVRQFYDGIATVSILGFPESKFLFTSSTIVGSKGKLPSRHIIKDGKLFYWWDNNYPLTQEMLDLLWKYNLLQDDEGGWIKVADFSADDKQKGAHYYFCKNDLSKYRRVVTNIGLGYYKPPKLKCK